MQQVNLKPKSQTEVKPIKEAAEAMEKSRITTKKAVRTGKLGKGGIVGKFGIRAGREWIFVGTPWHG